MENILNDRQLYTLMQHSPELDRIAAALPKAQQEQVLDLERRVGATYAAGDWQTQDGQVHRVPLTVAPPTTEEVQQVLGNAYIAIAEDKKSLRGLMGELDITPSHLKKGFLHQIVHDVQGWFR